jgi:L-arabinose isomerase
MSARIGFLPTVSYAYEAMTGPLRERKLAEAREAADDIASATGAGIVWDGNLVSNEREGRAAGEGFAQEQVAAVVVFPTVATMAAFSWAALEHHDWPVLIWSRVPSEPAPKTISEQVFETTNIGATAIGNVLARHRRVFSSVMGPNLTLRALAFIKAARTLATLRGGTLAHIGGMGWDSMLDVRLDPAHLEATLGLKIVQVMPDKSAAPVPEETCPVEDGLDPEIYRRSRYLAGAIEAQVRSHGALGGSLHCHGDAMAQDSDFGVVGCLAANRLTREGRPFSCTGDDCVAVALVLGQHLAGAVQYMEMDPAYASVNAVMLSNGGEGDLRMARENPPVRVCPNRFFCGQAGYGTCHDFVIAPGPASLINFTPIGDTYRVIVAEGEVLEELPPDLGMPRCFFRFGDTPAAAGFDRWCEAGANHHLGLVHGHHAYALRQFAHMACIEFRQVTGRLD